VKGWKGTLAVAVFFALIILFVIATIQVDH
jgi:hypothetical protein